jgi:hypothetical protein
VWDIKAQVLKIVSYNFTICHEGYYPFLDKGNWPTGSLEDPKTFSPPEVVTHVEWGKYGFDDDLSEMVGSKVSLVGGGQEVDLSPIEETKNPLEAACVIPFVEEKTTKASVGSTMSAVSNRQPGNHPCRRDPSSTGIEHVTCIDRETLLRDTQSYDRAKEDEKKNITRDITDNSHDFSFPFEGGESENRGEARRSARTWKPTSKALDNIADGVVGYPRPPGNSGAHGEEDPDEDKPLKNFLVRKPEKEQKSPVTEMVEAPGSPETPPVHPGPKQYWAEMLRNYSGGPVAKFLKVGPWVP